MPTKRAHVRSSRVTTAYFPIILTATVLFTAFTSWLLIRRMGNLHIPHGQQAHRLLFFFFFLIANDIYCISFSSSSSLSVSELSSQHSCLFLNHHYCQTHISPHPSFMLQTLSSAIVLILMLKIQ